MPRPPRDLNAGFVAIKVDREEHPEVDAAYMAAAAAFTRNLGWPLTVFVDTGGPAVLRRHLLPARAARGHPGVPAGARRRARGVDRAPRADRRHRRRRRLGARRVPRRRRRPPATRRPPTTSPTPPRRPRRARGPRVRRLRRRRSGAPKFPVATALRFLQAPAIRERRAGGVRRRRPRARRDGGLAAARPRRGRVLPLRDAPRLDGAALRADADRQRAAARRRARRRATRHRARHRRLPARRAAAPERRVRRGAGLGVVDRRRAQRGRLLRTGCRRPRARSSRRPSTARS